jgi:hypothetical protein
VKTEQMVVLGMKGEDIKGGRKERRETRAKPCLAIGQPLPSSIGDLGKRWHPIQQRPSHKTPRVREVLALLSARESRGDLAVSSAGQATSCPASTSCCPSG